MSFDGRLLAGVSALTAVIESGSFVRAAEALGITASGVSRAVARLETRVGARLLDRTTRTVSLNEEGRRFYERVKPSLVAIEEAAVDASGSASVVRGRLRARVAILVATRVLAGHLGEFLSKFPELSLDILTQDRTGDLVGDGIDVAISLGDQATSSLIARKLADIRILTVASPAYLERHGRPAHPDDLKCHACIHFRDPATGQAFPWEFHKGKKVLTVNVPSRLLLSDGNALIAECVAGFGVAQVTENSVHEFMDQGELIDLFPDWNGEMFPLYAFYPSRHPPAKARAFTDFVLELVRDPNAAPQAPFRN